jgi:GH43 family beta-xylosidase
MVSSFLNLKYFIMRKIKTILIPCVMLLMACSHSNSGGSNPTPSTPPDTTFTNPLLPAGPDPWVIQQDSYYYFMCTFGNKLAIYKTQYMDQLRHASPVTVWTPPEGLAYSRDIWAPELHLINNKWYIYFAADSAGINATHRTYVLENASADPLNVGAWVFKGKVQEPSDKWSIDATVFTYNGKNYMAWSGWQGDADGEQDIFIAEMLDPFTLGNRVLISKPEHAWETIVNSPIINEGPEAVFNANGNLFLTYSANGCWSDDYCLGMLSLQTVGNPMNPQDWTKSPNPVFTKNTGGGVFGPGHNGFFKSPDGKEDWIIYHANILTGQGCGQQRCPRIQKFVWNNDGTPNFGTPSAINMPINNPSGK